MERPRRVPPTNLYAAVATAEGGSRSPTGFSKNKRRRNQSAVPSRSTSENYRLTSRAVGAVDFSEYGFRAVIVKKAPPFSRSYECVRYALLPARYENKFGSTGKDGTMSRDPRTLSSLYCALKFSKWKTLTLVLLEMRYLGFREWWSEAFHEREFGKLRFDVSLVRLGGPSLRSERKQ